jgi:hypothetical protein
MKQIAIFIFTVLLVAGALIVVGFFSGLAYGFLSDGFKFALFLFNK